MVSRPRSRGVIQLAIAIWLLEVGTAAFWGSSLDNSWPHWRVGFVAVAVWPLSLIILYYGVGPPFALSRLPMLSTVFGFISTVLGCTNYWATTHRFPEYRVYIERAALFVALCTLLSLVGCLVVQRRPISPPRQPRTFVWNWARLRLVTYALAVVSVVGTYESVQRIGYVPLLTGDPESMRLTFAATAGVWLRLSTQGGILLALLAGAQICGRRGGWDVWLAGIIGLLCASAYGNRFFAALPVGATLLLWDRVRQQVKLPLLGFGFLFGVPVLALIGFWRYQDAPLDVLNPFMLVLWGTLMEFRDLAWAMDYYSGGHALLHGSTVGSLFMPILPGPVWSVMGIDKAAVYAQSNAVVLGQEMWQTTPQRIGIYGEFFINFWWVGAFIGAIVYGLLIGYVDRQILRLDKPGAVRAMILAVVGVVLVYAQIGQWDMDVTAVTSTAYPILLVALFAARRSLAGAPTANPIPS